jgi:predicted AlkP superfamily pyrophosphatase or phosphodiesterase
MLCLIAATVLNATTTFVDAPRLTVVISIDQFRRDYIGRFSDLFLAPTSRDGVGGFRWLSERGASFVNSAYTHIPTETGPGHAIIGTGSNPSLTGIVGNEWYDRESGKVVYCVSDPDSKDIFTGLPSYSPKNLRVGTFCDELERATGGLSRTASVSFKDRASILMAGRSADDVVWFDVKDGRWTTSDFYEKTGRLPDWATAINAEKRPDQFKGKSWVPTLSAETLKRASIPEKPGMPASFGKTFPHPIPDGESFYSNWQRTPWGNEFVLNSAMSALKSLSMGKDNIPDLIMINLSTNDYVGHWFGPDSPEVMDLTVATDKYLADFFRAIDKEVGLKNTMIVVTADHAIMPMPEEFTKNGQPGGRIDFAKFFGGLNDAVRDEYGGRVEIVNRHDQGIYLKVEEGDAEGADADTVAIFVRNWLRKQPEVYAAFSKWEFEEQKLPETAITRTVEDSYFPGRSADVAFFTRPGFLLSSFPAGASHGSPWIYDRAVPLLMAGRWVQPGKHTDESGPKDIAATLCAVWGIMPPTGSVGRALQIKPN